LDLVNLNKLKEAISGYLKIKIELIKLDITEHLSQVLSRIIAMFVIFIISMFVLAFASLALASYLNDLWGSSFGGYLVLSGIFIIVLTFTIYLLKSGKLRKFLEINIIANTSEDDS